MRRCVDADAAAVEASTPTSATEIQPRQSAPASSAPRPSLLIPLNDIPAELLGMALGYLPLADVLSCRQTCRQTRNRHLGRDAVRTVRHLNVTQTKELDARYATIFPSVTSIHVLCLLSKSAIISGEHNLPTFLEAFVGLERVFLDRNQVRRAMERLLDVGFSGDGAIRVLPVYRSRGGPAADEFIGRMAREGSGNNGQEEYVMSLTKEARAVLDFFHERDSATAQLVACEEAMTESWRRQMKDFCKDNHHGRTGKIVIRDATLDFLVDAVGFGLDREEFIPIDVDAEPAVLNYERWRGFSVVVGGGGAAAAAVGFQDENVCLLICSA